jgi:hypothetical protein
VSCRQSIALSHAWSTFSDVSLSEISLISAVVLPISSNDLVNRYHYQQNESPSPQASATLGDSSNPRFWPFGIQEFNGLDGKWSHEPSSALDEEPQAPWEDFGSYEADEEEAVRELHVRDVHYNTPEVSVPGTLHEGQMAESKLQTLVPVPMDQSNSNPLPQNITPQGDAAEDEASDHVNKLPIPAVLPFGESAEICGTIGDSTSDPSAQEPTFPRDLSEIYAAINWPTLSVPEKVRTRDGADDSDTLQENLGDADEQQLKGPQDILTSQVKNHLAGMKAATLSPQDALYDADSETMRSRSRSPRLGATEKRRIKSPSALPKKYKLVVLGARDTDITMQVSHLLSDGSYFSSANQPSFSMAI